MEWAIFYENIDLPSWTYHPSAVEHGFTFYFRFSCDKNSRWQLCQIGQLSIKTVNRSLQVRYKFCRLAKHSEAGQDLLAPAFAQTSLDSHWFALLSNDLGGCYYARLVLGVPLPSVICSQLAISNNLMTSGEKMTNCRFGFNTPWKEGKGSNTWVTIFLYLRGTPSPLTRWWK